ncbi:MAG: 50S ribosomal protein L13 [Thermoplasmatota archaeon]
MVIDASGLIIGRLSSHVAKSLLKDDNLEVAIINSEKAIVSGNRKMVIDDFIAKRALNHPRKGPNYPRMPDMILKRTIRGMLPYQKPRGREAYKRVKTYIGTPKEFEKSKLSKVPTAANKGLHQFVTLEEISRILGAKI